MRIIAVANQKGGVGKTSTAAALAGLARDDGRVLAVDLDPQGSLTHYFGLAPVSADRGVYPVLSGQAGLASQIRAAVCEGVDLVPAGTALASLEREQGRAAGMGLRLMQALDSVAADYAWAVLDVPPALGVLMINALAAADHLLIPTQTDPLARHGVEAMVRTVAMVNRSRPQPLAFSILPTFFDPRTRAGKAGLDALAQAHPSALLDTVIPMDTKVREAAEAGQPIGMLCRSCRAAASYQQAWMQLAPRVAGRQSQVAA